VAEINMVARGATFTNAVVGFAIGFGVRPVVNLYLQGIAYNGAMQGCISQNGETVPNFIPY